MGIVNLTPDSFFDGGKHSALDQTLSHIHRLIQGGANIIDLGAESSRPGSEPVSEGDEKRRLEPILSVYHTHFKTPLSLDTVKPEVAEFGLHHGVSILNDINGGQNPDMIQVAAKAQVPLVLMHKQGSPKTMQTQPTYTDVVAEVFDFLKTQHATATAAGIQKIIVDPGIGFGKTLEHNLALLHHLRHFSRLGCPLLIGASQKSFLGQLTGSEVQDRLPETLAAHLFAAQNGADILRVHNVAAHRNALKVAQALSRPWPH